LTWSGRLQFSSSLAAAPVPDTDSRVDLLALKHSFGSPPQLIHVGCVHIHAIDAVPAGLGLVATLEATDENVPCKGCLKVWSFEEPWHMGSLLPAGTDSIPRQACIFEHHDFHHCGMLGTFIEHDYSYQEHGFYDYTGVPDEDSISPPISEAESEVVSFEAPARIPPANGNASGAAERNQRVILLSFDRFTKELEDALLASPPALSALGLGIDLKPDWAKGAKIFTSSFGPEHLEEPIFEGELKAWHVLINEADEKDLLDALVALPIRYRKLKSRTGRVALPNHLSLLEISSEGENEIVNDAIEVIPYNVAGTFLNIPSEACRPLRRVASW